LVKVVAQSQAKPLLLLQQPALKTLFSTQQGVAADSTIASLPSQRRPNLVRVQAQPPPEQHSLKLLCGEFLSTYLSARETILGLAWLKNFEGLFGQEHNVGLLPSKPSEHSSIMKHPIHQYSPQQMQL